MKITEYMFGGRAIMSNVDYGWRYYSYATVTHNINQIVANSLYSLRNKYANQKGDGRYFYASPIICL